MSIRPARPEDSRAPHPGAPTAGAPTVGAAAAGAPALGRRRRLLFALAALAAVVFAVDQATKIWAEAALADGNRVPLVGDLLGFVLIHNAGAALSIATGMTWVLTVVATVVVVVIVRASRRIGSRGWALALGLLLGGALGNLADRFFREPGFARGHVVDFIAYGDFFVGNVADIAIVGAAGLIIALSLRGIRIDGSRESGSDATDPSTAATTDPPTEVAPTEVAPTDPPTEVAPTDTPTETPPSETPPTENPPTENPPTELRLPRG